MGGGLVKTSNWFIDYVPIYNITFGCNSDPKFNRPPGGIEEDRALIIYIANKLCDASEINRRPTSPRRYPKLDPDGRIRIPKSAWALLQILLEVRRGTPDQDDVISRGTPTSDAHC